MESGKPLELLPMDPPEGESPPALAAPTPAEAALDAIELVPVERAIPIANSGGSKIDPYVQQASREYAEGHIDAPLWDRAMAQAMGDKTAAAAVYVRARGTALRLFDRDRDRGVQPMRSVAPRMPRAVPVPGAVADEDSAAPKEPASWRRYRYPIIAAAVLVPLLAAGGWYLFSDRAGANPQITPVAAANPRSAAATLSPAAVVAAAKAANPTPVAPNSPSSPDFRKRIQELRDAGNWNVLVLFAVEWTRKEPGNWVAWDQLRAGYMYLRQYEDALNAAKKAVTLAPDEARLWRQVGEINLDIDDPVSALAAFEQAAARDPNDVASLQHVGLLQARLGRPQEAKGAFELALAAAPGDAVTTCLRTSVAQMPEIKDAYTMSRTIKAIDAKCHGRPDPIAVAAPVAAPAAAPVSRTGTRATR